MVGSSYFCLISVVLQTLEILEDLVEKGSENMDVRNMEEVVLRMKSAVASKQFGQEDVLAGRTYNLREVS